MCNDMIFDNIVDVKENNDGSLTIIFSEVSEELKTIIKQHFGIKRFTNQALKRFVIDALIYNTGDY